MGDTKESERYRSEKTSSFGLRKFVYLSTYTCQYINFLFQKIVDLFAQDNPSFYDDQFIIVEDADIQLEHKNIFNQNRISNSSWVTFDDDTPKASVTRESATSPVVEIGYEDLFKAHADQDKFVVIASDNHVTEAGLDDLLNHGNPPSAESKASVKCDSSRPTSLLTDTLSSVSPETRLLFAKSTSPSEAVVTQDARSPGPEKRRRRPPPKPPLPRTGHPHSHPPPVDMSLPRRPQNIPGFQSTIHRDTNEPETNCLQPIKTNTGNSPKDPFASLLMETRNSLPLNQNTK